MSEGIRSTTGPLPRGPSVLINALMRRLGVDSVTLTEDELGNGGAEVTATWDYEHGTVTLELT